MDTRPREGGRASQVEAVKRRAVGGERDDGTEDELADPLAAVADVAAHEVRVAALELGRSEHVPGEDQLAEARRETLDLPLQMLDLRRAQVGPRGEWPSPRV